MKKMKTLKLPGMSEVYKVYDEEAIRTINGAKPDEEGNIEVEASDGLPADATPNQQLVTDAEGNVKWEDRTHYKWDRITLKINPQNSSPLTSGEGYIFNSGTDNSQQAEAFSMLDKEMQDAFYNRTKYTNGYVLYLDGERFDLTARRIPVTFSDLRVYPFKIWLFQHGDTLTVEIEYYDNLEHTFEWVLENPQLKKLDEVFIPDTIARMVDLNNNKPTVPARGNLIIEWDGVITDRQKIFMQDTNDLFYKVSDTSPSFDEVEKVSAGTFVNDTVVETFEAGTNCYNIGTRAIIVTSPGLCVTSDGHEFEAKSAGVYLWRSAPDRFTNRCEIVGMIPDRGLRLYSSNGTPRDITVDETGVPIITDPYNTENTLSVPAIESAQVGQTIAVKSVDENGKPIEWEAVDMGAGGSASTSMLINLTYDGTKYVCSPNFATIKEYLMTASLDDWPIVQMKHDELDMANNTIKRTIYTATGMGHADDIIKHEMKWIDFMFTLSDGRAVTIRYNSDNTIAEVSK